MSFSLWTINYLWATRLWSSSVAYNYNQWNYIQYNFNQHEKNNFVLCRVHAEESIHLSCTCRTSLFMCLLQTTRQRWRTGSEPLKRSSHPTMYRLRSTTTGSAEVGQLHICLNNTRGKMRRMSPSILYSFGNRNFYETIRMMK